MTTAAQYTHPPRPFSEFTPHGVSYYIGGMDYTWIPLTHCVFSEYLHSSRYTYVLRMETPDLAVTIRPKTQSRVCIKNV